MSKQFERLTALIGEEKLNKLLSSTVAVIGTGGVGGVCAITLARSGVGNIIIQDFDFINESNINRQVVANYDTIGKYKIDVLEDMIKKINPNCNVTKVYNRLDESNISDLLDKKIDYLVDAIDDLNAKYLLIVTCIKNKVPFVSSGGAAKKMNLKKLDIVEISKTSYDPLAKYLRKKLHDDKIYDKVYIASSTEEIMDVQTLGSYMPVTATSGLLLADYVIKKIING